MRAAQLARAARVARTTAINGKMPYATFSPIDNRLFISL